jgi:hypothetical protein
LEQGHGLKIRILVLGHDQVGIGSADFVEAVLFAKRQNMLYLLGPLFVARLCLQATGTVSPYSPETRNAAES